MLFVARLGYIVMRKRSIDGEGVLPLQAGWPLEGDLPEAQVLVLLRPRPQAARVFAPPGRLRIRTVRQEASIEAPKAKKLNTGGVSAYFTFHKKLQTHKSSESNSTSAHSCHSLSHTLRP